MIHRRSAGNYSRVDEVVVAAWWVDEVAVASSREVLAWLVDEAVAAVAAARDLSSQEASASVY